METRLAGTGASGTNPRPQLDATSPENERTRYARTATQQAGRERYQISTHIKQKRTPEEDRVLLFAHDGRNGDDQAQMRTKRKHPGLDDE